MCKLWVVLLVFVLTGCLKDVNTEEINPNDDNSQADTRGASPSGDTTGNAGGQGNQGGSTSFSLSWTPPTENTDGSALTNLAGYRVYFGVESGRYTDTIRIDTTGITRYVVDNVPMDTYFVVMTAVTATGLESDYTNEVAVMSN